MKTLVLAGFISLAATLAPAATRYVDANSANPAAPYNAWTNAARIIQVAVDASASGDEIVVTNGVYATGGRAVYGTMTNRVAVYRAITLRSVNGPEVTIIQGYQLPGTTNGDGAIRCAYMTNGAVLSGFTLTNGATRNSGDWEREQNGGGVWGEGPAGVATNCILTGNSAYYYGGGAQYGTLNNCKLTRNASASYGGGASRSTLNNCTLTGNSAVYGGGAYSSTLTNCVISGNWAQWNGGGTFDGTLNNCTLMSNSTYYGGGSYYGKLLNCLIASNAGTNGGGAHGGVLNNCTLANNSAKDGGGADSATLTNCTVTGNSATEYGGGAFYGTLINCALSQNSSQRDAGGAYYALLNNCTLIGNSANSSGGGAYYGTLTNCIVYYNSTLGSGPNYYQSTVSYSCTLPLPTNGVGNITSDPVLANPSHLSALSPCRGAGNAACATGLDVDGEVWLNPPSMGCDEYRAGSVTGALAVAISAPWTSVAVGFALDLAGLISGRTVGNVWAFGDGMTLSNRPYASHSWAAPGDYAVALRAYNESNPGGVSATVTVRVVAEVHYVAAGGLNPTAPYTNWATAAQNIQDAVDAVALPGALVLVSNGVYATGGRTASGCLLTNRVTADRPVAIRSVNGPEVTVIEGWPKLGNEAVRCVYLTNGATLSGFTLTNGTTRNPGGGSDVCGAGVFCESTSVIVSNCILAGNYGLNGGGAYQGTLANCTLLRNRYSGAKNSVLNYCTIRENNGGGAKGCLLNNCILTGNSADRGGGASSCILNNCALTGNGATEAGGGAAASTLNNCTLIGNSASTGAGGADGCSLNNCIVYYNMGGLNYSGGTLNYCCTTPMPTNGIGNITNEPALAGLFHISEESICRQGGDPAYASGLDIDGETWLAYPSIGCDEYRAELLTGAVSVAIITPWTRVTVGFSLDLTGIVEGRVSSMVWDFGDGVFVSNLPYASHSWAAPGDYAVVLRAYNESNPGGVSTSVMVRVEQPVHYVAAGSTSPTPPFTNWATAARSLQEGVDAAAPGGLVLVSNGVYDTGGRSVNGFFLTNRIAVDKPITVRSVNGPKVTIIQGCQVPGTVIGDGAVRCAYLTNGAALNGFTLTNGSTEGPFGYEGDTDLLGGGVWCESANAVLANCILVGNSALAGGGSYGGTLNNCVFMGNPARYGGAAYSCWLNNCTLAGNLASYGGGVYGSVLNNCILYYNVATNSGANYYASTLTNCCAIPDVGSASGNITNEPAFVDLAGGNLRLQSNSPCINAGNNAYVTNSTDLDGRPRIVGGTVDMGAYEYQGSGMSEFIGWLAQFALPTDGTADFTDADHDGFNNYQEYRCGSNPTNALSFLRLLPPAPAGADVTLSWPSGTGRSYVLECSTNLGATPPFLPLATHLPGQPGTTSFTITNGAGLGPCFYRVGAE